jgi:hypothetical protein
MKMNPYPPITKTILAALMLAILGLPILTLWKMFLLLVGWLALVDCSIRYEPKRIVACLLTIAAVLSIKSALPRAGIEEGHNIFLYLEEGEAIQKGIPPRIFHEWKRAFDTIYPTPDVIQDYTWRHNKEVPETAFVYSTDSIWRPAKYSRVVDSIDFKNLPEFRGGFANMLKYNWWKGRLPRRAPPFFVMYEFPSSAVGCKLFWQGAVFWEKPDGSIKRIIHEKPVGQIITYDMAGSRAYSLFFPGVFRECSLRLELSPKLRYGHIADNILSVLGIVALLWLMTRVNRKPYITTLVLMMFGLVIIALFVQVQGRGMIFGQRYHSHFGGDDGLVHESYGRDMARAAAAGDFKKAFRGTEDIYWFTPGTRYFMAAEKILFGDTNLGYTALLACLPWLVYLIINHLCWYRAGLFSAILFLFLPVSLSFYQYNILAFMGFGEAVGSFLFLAGFYLFLRAMPSWGGEGEGEK